MDDLRSWSGAEEELHDMMDSPGSLQDFVVPDDEEEPCAEQNSDDVDDDEMSEDSEMMETDEASTDDEASSDSRTSDDNLDYQHEQAIAEALKQSVEELYQRRRQQRGLRERANVFWQSNQ